MGRPVVHFEVIGTDAQKLQSFYSELFGWEIDANNPMSYGVVSREGNLSPEGIGIGGGIGTGPPGYSGHVTFYIGVPDVEAGLADAERLGGTRMMGPDEVMQARDRSVHRSGGTCHRPRQFGDVSIETLVLEYDPAT